MDAGEECAVCRSGIHDRYCGVKRPDAGRVGGTLEAKKGDGLPGVNGFRAEICGEIRTTMAMTDREKILFERLLCLAANEYGKTRDEMLAWVNDDEDWQADYPQPYAAPPGTFIQKTAKTFISRQP